MLAIITTANDDYWYEFKEVNTIEDLLKIYNHLVIEPNVFDKDIVEFWDGFKTDDIPKLAEAKIHVIIYNDYIE